MQNNDALIVPFFKTVAKEDKAASKKAGRPIFKDEEVVEVRIAGDRNFAPVFPAHSMWKRVDGEEITYAERFRDAYAQFKEGAEQIASGTPLSELPFLSVAKRAELRALKIYTAEALASLDGKNLTNLGGKGRELKNSAIAYLERASGAADTAAMSAEIASLREQIAAMAAPTAETQDEDAEKEALKEQIAAATGSRPRGNPSVETLREMAANLEAA